VLKVSEAFVECPNADCASFGFFVSDQNEGESFNEIQCKLPFECTSCQFIWCTAAQKKASFSVFSMQYWKDFELAELPIFTNLYKSFCSEKCPNCDVMIIRTGGCKFMTCSKCKYQFCWYCLDEFYTEYHYHYSDCPFRIVLFYILQTLCLGFLVTKLYTVNPRFRAALENFIWVVYQIGIFFVYAVVWATAIDGSQIENKKA